MSDRRLNTTSIAVLIIFAIAYVFLFITFISPEEFNFIVFLPTLLSVMFLWLAHTENPTPGFDIRRERIVFDSCVMATLAEPINYDVEAGKCQALLYIENRIYNSLPNRDTLVVMSKGVSGFFDLWVGSVTVLWTGEKSKLKRPSVCELPEGGYRYYGSLTGVPMESEYQILHNELSYFKFIVSRNSNTHFKMKSVLDAMSKSSDKGVMAVTEKLGVMMKDLLEVRKEQQIEQMPVQQRQNYGE